MKGFFGSCGKKMVVFWVTTINLDHLLKDPRTSVVLCSRFNDAPGTSAKAFLQHMKQTFSERFDVGKVSILSLPRTGEARAR